MVATLQKQISQGIRSARLGRRLSQAKLAQKLGISQSRLSEIEQGKGSITAEQFIVMLQFFNLPISHFVKQEKASFEDQLQNRLIQLGGTQLREKADVLPSEKLSDVCAVILESLISGFTSRRLMALVPVIIKHIDQASLKFIESKLKELGLENRLYWLMNGVGNALHMRLQLYVSREYKLLYKKAEIEFSLWGLYEFANIKKVREIEDVLDQNIMSQKTLDQVRTSRDALAKTWNIVTRVTQENFSNALLEMEKS
jgi:transcriptional regulator with XRE-family HTH domain